MLRPSLEELGALLPPPDRPADPGTDAEWELAERELGTRLPNDYKAFIRLYGSGGFDDFLYYFNACSADPVENLPRRALGFLADDRRLRAGSPRVTWPLFPEPRGWLPWGTTPNGNKLWWVTDGAPEEWKVAVTVYDPIMSVVYDETYTSFLEGVLSRRIHCKLLGSYFPSADRVQFTR
jgi:hypothetical protein